MWPRGHVSSFQTRKAQQNVLSVAFCKRGPLILQDLCCHSPKLRPTGFAAVTLLRRFWRGTAVSSPVTRLAGLSQGRSRVTERSPVKGFSQTSPTFMGLRSGAPFGSGCDIRAQVIGDVWSATLPQSDKGRVARHPPESTCALPEQWRLNASQNPF